MSELEYDWVLIIKRMGKHISFFGKGDPTDVHYSHIVDVEISPKLHTWVDVIDRLPSSDKRELYWVVCAGNDSVPRCTMLRRWCGEKWEFHISSQEIIYWMEIPEPPEYKNE